MQFLTNLLTLVFAVALVVCAFQYLFDPHKALATLKNLGKTALGLIVGAALLQKVAANPPSIAIDPAVIPGLLVVSALAYAIRQHRLKKPGRNPERTRGTERTPVMPQHLDGGNA